MLHLAIYSVAISMFLLYAALAYMAGIALGRLWWDRAGLAVPCRRGSGWRPWWVWLPCRSCAGCRRHGAARLHCAGRRRPASCARRPAHTRPWRSRLSCVQRPVRCATWGSPSPRASARTSWRTTTCRPPPRSTAARPQVTILGYVDSYPQVADTQQELTIQARALESTGSPTP